jgi:hypothetical protein
MVGLEQVKQLSLGSRMICMREREREREVYWYSFITLALSAFTVAV